MFKVPKKTSVWTKRPQNLKRKVLSGYYAFLGREIRDDDPFIVLDFELI